LWNIVAESPERVAEVQAALQAAKDDGLPWHVYAVLRGNLDLIGKRSGQSFDEGSGAPCAPSNNESVEDKTIVLGDRDQDPTTAHASETGAGETGTPTGPSSTEDDRRFLEERNVDATTATAACMEKLARNDKLPVTGISLAEAKSYADWLSTQATTAMNRRVVYRLPNDREWRHAAAARGEVSSRAINCRPEGGSSLSAGLITSQGGSFSLSMPIGRSLVSATFGEANGWGVVNAVGNAQEWAITGAGVVARGGAFKDPAASCSVDAGRSHDGSADPVTGFRLVRELD